jgi:hypothetical protein
MEVFPKFSSAVDDVVPHGPSGLALKTVAEAITHPRSTRKMFRSVRRKRN